MQGPCEHCGNPMKEFWTTQCMYKGNFPSRRAFVLSTSDPPCAGDAYDEGQSELARSHLGKKMLAMLAVLSAIAAFFWLLK